MTRAQYARGVDTLWNEQCDQYAQGMAHVESMGVQSRAWQQVQQATDENARRGFAILVSAQGNRARHTVMYPDAYTGWTAEPRPSALFEQIMGRGPLVDTLVPDRQSERWELERRADLLLADDPIRTLDVTVRGHLQVKPDRVAYRGQVRYRRPRPCKYHAEGIARTAWMVAADGTVMPPAVEYRTDVNGAGYGWQGHRRIVIGTRAIARGKVARKARVRTEQATGARVATRGKAVSWWSMSERSLPRWWTKATDTQQATAATLESVLRTSAHDARVELCDGHAVIIDAGCSMVRRDEPASRFMPIREYSRRAALAGITID